MTHAKKVAAFIFNGDCSFKPSNTPTTRGAPCLRHWMMMSRSANPVINPGHFNRESLCHSCRAPKDAWHSLDLTPHSNVSLPRGVVRTSVAAGTPMTVFWMWQVQLRPIRANDHKKDFRAAAFANTTNSFFASASTEWYCPWHPRKISCRTGQSA